MTQTFRKGEPRDPGDAGGTHGGSILGTVGGIVGTLKAHWKLLVPLWLILSALLVTLIFLLPKEYGKNLTLAVTPTQSGLQATLAQPPLDPAQAKNQAVKFLEQADLAPVRVIPEFDPAIPQEPVQVRLESQNRRALNGAPKEVVAVVEEGFRGTYERSLGSALERQLATVETQATAYEETLAGIDAALEATRPTGPDDVEGVVKRTVLESNRQETLGLLSFTEAQREPLVEAQENLSEVAAEPIVVEVANEAPVRQNNPRGPSAAFAVLLGFVASAAVVLWVAARRKRRSIG